MEFKSPKFQIPFKSFKQHISPADAKGNPSTAVKGEKIDMVEERKREVL